MSERVQPQRPDETGVIAPFPHMHPLMKTNHGNWAWHDRLRPGVLHHVAHGGDEIWTVRAGTQRQMDVYTIRKLCDIVDEYAEGHVRFTTRSNIEFMVSTPAQVAPLINELEGEGFPAGGAGKSVSKKPPAICRDPASGYSRSLPGMCQHCADPPCVDVCPTGASFKRADGIVLVD